MSASPPPEAEEADFYHVTSPGVAQSVLREGVYTPISTAPTDGDSGLNGFTKTQTFWPGQELGGYGVRIYFRWQGKIVALPSGTPPPLPNGILLDQAPWRLHLRGPIGPEQLRVTRVAFADEALIEFLDEAFWERWLFKRWRPHRRRRLRFLQELRTLYRSQPCFVSIDY